MRRLLVLVLVLVLADRVHAQTPDVVGLRNGNVTFTNLDTSLEYHVEWAAGVGGTNQFIDHFRGQEYITTTGSDAMTVSAPQFFRIAGQNKLSNGIYRISDLPTVVTGGSAKVDVEWAADPSGPWYTNWVTPQEQSDTSSVIVVQTPRFFRLNFVTCPSNFASCSDWSDQTDPASNRVVNFPVAGFNYDPKCLKIVVGQSITFSAVATTFASHPFTTDCQEQPAMTNQNSGTTATFMFIKPGYYGFHCAIHGNSSGAGMSGNIWVIP